MYNHDLRPQGKIIQCLLGNLSKYDFKELFTHSCAMMYLFFISSLENVQIEGETSVFSAIKLFLV
jgi:hypothetical protein